MNLVISINGNDGSGKTTQIDLLRKNSNKSTYFPPDIAEYGVFPKLPEKEAFEWWFFNSSIEEFCKAIYKGIQYRDNEIAAQNKPIVILDKGIDTFDARILANFMCRGMKYDEILKKMQEVKKEIGIQSKEDIKLFLMLNKDMEVSRKIAKSRKGVSFGQSYYDRYQSILEKITEEKMKRGVYRIIDASGSIEEVNKNIINIIKTKIINEEKNKDREEER